MDGPEEPQGDLESWIVLGLIGSMSPQRRRKIETAYGSLSKAALAGPFDWKRRELLPSPGSGSTLRPGSGGPGPEPLSHLEDTMGWARREAKLASRRGVRILRLGDPGYPGLLADSPGPPAVIYVSGHVEALSRHGVAIVGARRASAFGRGFARRLAADLSREGLMVYSGGARGIDSEAHLGALEAGGGTVAVLGCGLDVTYPPENARLFEGIAASGALVSEFPFGTSPQPYHFPIRNRVIAGLSLAVVVVEGTEGSGSLITAARALDANRDVMAMPGAVVSALSAGPNRLIAEGAGLVRSADDVLAALPYWTELHPLAGGDGREAALAGLSSRDRAALEAVDPAEGSTADEIAAALGAGAGEALGRLTGLELGGFIERMPDGRFVRRQ